MIKKIIFVLSAALCALSCFDDGNSFSTKYTLDTTFEYQNAFQPGDSLLIDKTSGAGFGQGQLAFYHQLSESKAFMGGFMLSRLSGKGDSEENNRYRVNSGNGMAGSSNYLVYYYNPQAGAMPKKDIEFTASDNGICAMIGCYVNNTKEVVKAVQEKFVDGDRLAVRMTGMLGGKVTASQEFVLAEYTEAKDSLVTKWAPFELGKLGNIDCIEVEVISTRNDIPAAFCLDDMIARVEIEY